MTAPSPDISSLSIVIPCHNEAGTIVRVVADALREASAALAASVSATVAASADIDPSEAGANATLPDRRIGGGDTDESGRGSPGGLEIIVVDDGSSDETGPLSDALAVSDRRVRVVHNPESLGYGGALARGFGAATGDWVFYTDGDGQFDLSQIQELLRLAAPGTVVAGYRLRRKDPPLRRLSGRAWTLLMNVAFGLRVRDVDCAFKLFPRELLSSIAIRSTGALISAELLARASHRGFSIVQIGVRHRPRMSGRPTGGSARVITRAFFELSVLWWAIRRDM